MEQIDVLLIYVMKDTLIYFLMMFMIRCLFMQTEESQKVKGENY